MLKLSELFGIIPHEATNMRVTVGEFSHDKSVLSDALQGTVLGPLLPISIKSTVRLFADDCLICREIKTPKKPSNTPGRFKETMAKIVERDSRKEHIFIN